ncbi:MAG: hybrid sensor histidine kinase/response regulator [Bacteroidales bacterium]|nr:hybrid sensor histidine kinase/response regulator [Bacteroidales bacterium]
MNIKDSTILIVDDIPQNLKIVGTILTENDYKTFASLSGKQALEIVSERQIDLILLDISMPEMDGFEVCKVLKDNPLTRDIPVIFLTARTQIEDVVKGFDIGGVDYITKPFNMQELLKRVENHLYILKQKQLIKRQNEELKELNVSKSKFLSIISHDLRNPFSAILMFAELLLENNNEIDNLKKDDVIKNIKNGTENVMKLLEDLLKWSKSQMHNLQLVPNEEFLKPLVRDVISILKEPAQNKKIKVIENIDDEISFYADVDSITTVVRNLLSNSIKFSNKEGQIIISAKDIDDNFIEVSVTDDGIGIAEEKLGDLFRIDKKVVTLDTNNEKGAGLGLILCKEFVEKNGGKIMVKSEIGKGSTFSFTIPKKAI